MKLYDDFDLDLMRFVLLFFTFWMILFSVWIRDGQTSLFPPPMWVTEMFNYGKASSKSSSTDLNFMCRVIRFIEIRKSNFLHFYIFGLLYASLILIICVYVYVLGQVCPQFIIDYLDFFSGSQRTVSNSTPPIIIILALLLMILQCIRRTYECMFVNTPSKATMNILHYIVGFVHYFISFTSIITHAPGFHRSSELRQGLNFIDIGVIHLITMTLFTYAWSHQAVAHFIFAHVSTKKEKSGRYAVPYGDLFKFVSCPHYFCEIVIYLSLAILLGLKHTTVWFVFLWVLINQTVAAKMSYNWYKINFYREFPANRRVIFPFLF